MSGQLAAPPLGMKTGTDRAKAPVSPDLKSRFDTFAFEPISWSAEEITRNTEAKAKVYSDIVKKANISLD